MRTKRPFIDRQAFHDLIAELPRADGAKYEDIDTIYGDLSRLVVGLMARMKPEDLQREYEAGTWKGSANVRAIHEAAKLWMTRHRS